MAHAHLEGHDGRRNGHNHTVGQRATLVQIIIERSVAFVEHVVDGGSVGLAARVVMKWQGAIVSGVGSLVVIVVLVV